MDRTAVRSRDLAIVGYDRGTSILEIAFKTGRVYHYFGVPEEIYNNLMSAPSLGSFFEQHIKHRYSYTKVA